MIITSFKNRVITYLYVKDYLFFFYFIWVVNRYVNK